MSVRDQILEDMKTAMKARDAIRLDAIRFLQAAIKKQEIDSRPNPLTEEDVSNVIKKMAKQRKESIEQFKAAQRQDLVDKETAELKILEGYLPKQMDPAAVEKIVADTIKELNASSLKDMGAVIKAVITKTAGQADNKTISELVKSKLS